MEPNVQRLLNDKLYDKRKTGALEYATRLIVPLSYVYYHANMAKPLRLERCIRDLTNAKDYKRVQDILEQLCNEYAYAVHQPHARNGGLIGLAAAAIALGPVSLTSFVQASFTLYLLLLDPFPADLLQGTTKIPRDYCSAGPGMFYRSRCSCPILCLRVHV